MENNIAYRTFNLINQERARYGKAALGWDNSMYNLSLEHTNNMASGRVPLGHDGFNNRTSRIPFQWSNVAENCCYNYGNDPASEAVRQWMASPGHFQNIMGDFNVSGLACVKSYNGAYYFTQLFAKR